MSKVSIRRQHVLFDQLRRHVLVKRYKRLILLQHRTKRPAATAIHAVGGVLDEDVPGSEIDAGNRS